jgi:hypothetical protein
MRRPWPGPVASARQRRPGHDLHGNAPVVRLVRIELTRAEHQLLGTLNTNDARQRVKRAAVGDQAYALNDMQKRAPCAAITMSASKARPKPPP